MLGPAGLLFRLLPHVQLYLHALLLLTCCYNFTRLLPYYCHAFGCRLQTLARQAPTEGLELSRLELL